MVATFESLPREVLLQIAAQLNRPALATFCSISRPTRTAGMTLLFNSITLHNFTLKTTQDMQKTIEPSTLANLSNLKLVINLPGTEEALNTFLAGMNGETVRAYSYLLYNCSQLKTIKVNIDSFHPHLQDTKIADLIYVKCTESNCWQKLAYLLSELKKRGHQPLHIATELSCTSYWRSSSLSYDHAAHILRQFDSIGDVNLTLEDISFNIEGDCLPIDLLGDVENLRIKLLSCRGLDRILPSIGPHLAQIRFEDLEEVTDFSDVCFTNTIDFPRLKSVKVDGCSYTDGNGDTVASVLQGLLSSGSLGGIDEMTFSGCSHMATSDFTAMLQQLIITRNHNHSPRTVTFEDISCLDILRECEAFLEAIASLLRQRNGQLKLSISIGEEFFEEWYMKSVTTSLIPLEPTALSSIHEIQFFIELPINMLSDCPIVLMPNLSKIEIVMPRDAYWTLAFHRFMSKVKAPKLRTLYVKDTYSRGIYARIVSILLWIPSTCVWHLHVVLPRKSKEVDYFESEQAAFKEYCERLGMDVRLGAY